MTDTRFETSAKGHVLYGRFVREDGLSTFSEALLQDIDRFCARVEADDGIRAVIITSAGRVFSLGTDLEQLAKGFEDPRAFRRYLVAFKHTMNRVERLPVPTIAAVNGLTRAGGLEIVLACDLAIISDDARIGDAHAAQHAIPAGGSTQRLPRRIGVARAKELIWSGRFLSAAEAVDCGLCYKVSPAAELMSSAEALASGFIDKPRQCLTEIKSLIARSESMSMADGIDLEIHAFLNYVQNYPYVKDAFDAFRNAKALKSAPSAATL